MTGDAVPTQNIKARNIILAGFMGSGKTTVGRLLAQRLHWDFLDCDEEIERRSGRLIAHIFEHDGEPAFRKMERDLARDLRLKRHTVISTGGGFVTNPESREAALEAGEVVYLAVTPDEVWRRVAGMGHRPLLNCEDPEGRIRDLLEARRAAYESLPHRIETDGLTPERVAGMIVEHLSSP